MKTGDPQPQSISISELARGTRAIVERLAREPGARYVVMRNNRAVAEITGAVGGAPAVHARAALADEVLAKKALVRTLARAHGVRSALLFGSAARGDDRPQSDIDLMVELEPGRSLLDLTALACDLEEAFGRRVDVVEQSSVRPVVRAAALREGIRIL